MKEYGTLESPFDPEYLVEVLEAAGFEDVTRYARVDELFELGADREASARIGRMMKYPDLNTLVARKPGGGGNPFAAEISAVGDWHDRDGGRAIRVLVANTGACYWPTAPGFPYPEGTVTVGPYVDRQEGNRLELPRAVLPRPVSPGASTEVDVVLARDAVRPGERVRLDLVREGIAWFEDLGSRSIELPALG
jgi:hypothetical protein